MTNAYALMDSFKKIRQAPIAREQAQRTRATGNSQLGTSTGGQLQGSKTPKVLTPYSSVLPPEPQEA